MAVREIIDDNVFEDLPTIIAQHHDGTADSAALGTPTFAKCRWPPALLGQMAEMAAKCSRTQGKLRTSIGVALPELERLVGNTC